MTETILMQVPYSIIIHFLKQHIMVNAIKCLFEVQKDNKQLLDEVFVICRIINVEVKVISRAEGEADNSYRDIDNSAYHKNRIR